MGRYVRPLISACSSPVASRLTWPSFTGKVGADIPGTKSPEGSVTRRGYVTGDDCPDNDPTAFELHGSQDGV